MPKTNQPAAQRAAEKIVETHLKNLTAYTKRDEPTLSKILTVPQIRAIIEAEYGEVVKAAKDVCSHISPVMIEEARPVWFETTTRLALAAINRLTPALAKLRGEK